MILKESQALLEWFRENQRDLPWRKSTPWGVMVSEFMLAQTPVNRVLPKWTEWMQRWPTPVHLSKASSADVILAWERLGYPRRALRLHESAKLIVTTHNGIVPDEYEKLIALPGVGDYTAAAILSFAFNKRAVVLDTNIRRVISRWQTGVALPSGSISQVERALADRLIPIEAALWAGATMELGALICTSKKPNCLACPLAKKCEWKRLGYPERGTSRKVAPWHGSDRQCRGTIMAAIRGGPSLIHEISWPKADQLQRCIASLEKEGLLEREVDLLQLPSSV